MRVGDAPRVSSVNFSLSVGTVVPRTVKYVLLPPRVVEIYPAWRGYHFFIVGDQIVIVEPGSLRIVAVIPAQVGLRHLMCGGRLQSRPPPFGVGLSPTAMSATQSPIAC